MPVAPAGRDSVYLALARDPDADATVTTDRNFEGPCEALEYHSLVPDKVLVRFDPVDWVIPNGR